jgi:hypothetical protein
MGNIAGGRRNAVGGLVGENYGRVVSSSSGGSIRAKDDSQVGGLIGTQAGNAYGRVGSTLNSHSTARVTGASDSYAGGLIGLTSGSVMGSWASGAVSIGDELSIGPPASAGGLAGYFFAVSSDPGTIANSYATGPVSGGQGTNVGGLIGVTFAGSNSDGPIVDSYSTGAVAGSTGSVVGGFIGYEARQANSDDYWDTDTSGISDLSKGTGNVANEPGIAGLTTAQFQSGLPAGFDPSIWAQDPGINGGLPYLIANPP